MIVADTSVWIPFFNCPESLEKKILDRLIDRENIAKVGVVLAELLQGCRSQDERERLREALLALPYLEVSQSTWIQTGDISANLLGKGITLPMTDLIIAAQCIEHRCEVHSQDALFNKIPKLRRYSPV